MNANVAFIIFNRPDLTARVFSEIARARPARLFIVADGPRAGTAGDAERIMATRKVTDSIDWPCEVHRNYADANLGCRNRVSSGLDWVFGMVDDAVILEDDCLPDQSFFPFCCELLERYRTDERIMHISGDNFQGGIRRTAYSYYFSQYPHCWGWATWRRAWRLYDAQMEKWAEFKRTKGLARIFSSRGEIDHWDGYLDMVCHGKVDSWASVWVFSCWAGSGLSILPEVNLVSNIGFGLQSTHTLEKDSRLANLPIEQMTFPLRHPREIAVCERADRIVFRRFYQNDPGPMRRIIQRISSQRFWGAQVRRIPFVGNAWARWCMGRGR